MMDEAPRHRRVKARDSLVCFLWRPRQAHLTAPVQAEGGGGQDARILEGDWTNRLRRIQSWKGSSTQI